jgi:hypothetical protein
MSRTIRAVTAEPVSHVVIATGEHYIHSNMLGVRADPISGKSIGTPLYTIDIADDYEKLLSLFVKRSRSSYDFGAILYLALRRVFRFLPKKNLWQCSGMYLCTEWVTEFVDGEADSMITPYKLYLRLKDRSEKNAA